MILRAHGSELSFGNTRATWRVRHRRAIIASMLPALRRITGPEAARNE